MVLRRSLGSRNAEAELSNQFNLNASDVSPASGVTGGRRTSLMQIWLQGRSDSEIWTGGDLNRRVDTINRTSYVRI